MGCLCFRQCKRLNSLDYEIELEGGVKKFGICMGMQRLSKPSTQPSFYSYIQILTVAKSSARLLAFPVQLRISVRPVVEVDLLSVPRAFLPLGANTSRGVFPSRCLGERKVKIARKKVLKGSRVGSTFRSAT